MDGDGASRKNETKKSTASTGRTKPSKRILSPNSTDNPTNSKKRKTLNFVNNPLKTVKSNPINLQNKNHVLDIPKNIEHSIIDLEKVHDFSLDKQDAVETNSSKRMIKNITKFTDFITNVQADVKKRKKSNTVKVKPPDVTKNLQIEENALNTIKDAEIKINETNKTDVNRKQHSTRPSLSTTEQSPSLNNRRKSINENKKIIDTIDPKIPDKTLTTPETSVCINNSNETKKDTSLQNNVTRRITRSKSHNKKAKLDDEINESSENLNDHQNVTSKKLQPFVLLSYDEKIENLIRNKSQTQKKPPAFEEKNILNKFDSSFSQLKAEDDIDHLVPRIDEDDIKMEAISPCSSNSDLSGFFSPMRSCHIHLERLSINLSAPEELNVDNTPNCVIPTCQCKGETDLQKCSQFDVVDHGCPEHNTNECAPLDKDTETNLTPTSPVSILPNKNVALLDSSPQEKVPGELHVPMQCNKAEKKAPRIKAKENSRNRKRLITPISYSHVADIIEEVIKANRIESPENTTNPTDIIAEHALATTVAKEVGVDKSKEENINSHENEAIKSSEILKDASNISNTPNTNAEHNSKQEEDIQNNKLQEVSSMKAAHYHHHQNHHHHHHQHHSHHKVSNNEHQKCKSLSSSKNEIKSSIELDENILAKRIHFVDANKKKDDNKKIASKDIAANNKAEHRIKEDNKKSKTEGPPEKLQEIISSKNKRRPSLKVKEDGASTNTQSPVTHKEDNSKSSKSERSKLKEAVSLKNTHSGVTYDHVHKSKEESKQSVVIPLKNDSLHGKHISSKNTDSLVTNKEDHKNKDDRKKCRTLSSGNLEKQLPVKLKEDISHSISASKEEQKIKEDSKKSSPLSKSIVAKKEDVKKSSSHKNEKVPTKQTEHYKIKGTTSATIDSSAKVTDIKTCSNRAFKKHVKNQEEAPLLGFSTSTLSKISSHEKNVSNIETQNQVLNLTERKIKTSVLQKSETSSLSSQTIKTSPQRGQILCSLEKQVKTSLQHQNLVTLNNSPQKVQSQMEMSRKLDTFGVPVQEVISPYFSDSKGTKMMESTNVNSIITKQSTSKTDKSVVDLRQKISEKRGKEKIDTSNKYKNFVIKASDTNRVVIDNSIETISNDALLLPKTLKISPNKFNESPIKDVTFSKCNQSPIKDVSPNKMIISPEIKMKVLDKVIIRSKAENLTGFNKETHTSNIVTEKLNKMYKEQMSATNSNNIARNETNTTISQNTHEGKSNEPSDFVFMKPKHTFKFIEKCEVKRPPTRKPHKITLNRPTLQTVTTESQGGFKAPMEKKREPKLNRVEFSKNKRNMDDDDIISILADPSGLDSVCDAASVKNDDSDYEEELNTNEAFMDNERFTQVKHWLTSTAEEPVTPVPEPEPEPLVPLLLSPPKKSIEIPVARVNPGIQVTNSEEKSTSVSNESNKDERLNIKLAPENKKTERPAEVDFLKNICFSKFRKDCCFRKKCIFAHSLHKDWETCLKNLPIDTLLRSYRFVKDYKLFQLYKMMLSIVAGQLGAHNDFNNLTNLVKDVLELEMNTDREPLIKDIIQALVRNGFSYYSTVEILFRSANVGQGFKNLLCDILLNLTVERKQLEDDWPLIQMLSAYKKFDIDKGIIQFIIIEAFAKTYLQKELIVKVYNDLIKRVPDFNMKTISATLCEKFIEMLRKYNLNSDADNLMERCVSLNILERRIKKQIKEQQEETLCNSPTKDTKPSLISNEYETKEDSPQNQSARPPSYPEYQPQQEHSKQKKQEHYTKRPRSHPQYQPQQEQEAPQQTSNQYPHKLKQEHSNKNQSQEEQLNLLQEQDMINEYEPEHPQLSQKYQQRRKSLSQYQFPQSEYHPTQKSQSEYQPQQEYQKQETCTYNQNQNQYQQNEMQFESQEHDSPQSRAKYKQMPLNYPILPGLRADKSNYPQYFRSTQPTAAKFYFTETKQNTNYGAIQSEPSTSQSNTTMVTHQTPNSDAERFLCYSTENLDLLANTAQNMTEGSSNVDINNAMVSSPDLKQIGRNFLAFDNKTAEDMSFTAMAPSPTTLYNNFAEIKQYVAEENFTSIMQLILKYKEGVLTDVFLNHLINALIETHHNYPTFFSTLSKMSELANDNSLNYILKTIGVNLILHLCQNNQCEPAIRLNNILTTKWKSSEYCDVYNCKVYLQNNYSYMKRILIITQMYIIKGDAQTAWNMLRDNILSCGSYLKNNHDETDLKYVDFVLTKLFESFKRIKNCHIALDALLYLMKYKSSDMNIPEHANSILVNAINNRCSFDKIEEFMSITPNWYHYLGKNTIRAILVTALLDHKESVESLYQIALKLRICPQLMGNEKTITLYGHYHYAELQIYLDKFFQNMVNYMPITEQIIITFLLNDESSDDEIPILVQQYNSSKTVFASRVANILENIMKPSIQLLNRNNCLYLDPKSVNTHLMYRQQSNL